MDDGVSLACPLDHVRGPDTDLDQVLPLILELSGGDMRKAITYMQTGQRLHQAQTKPTPLSTESSESQRLRSLGSHSSRAALPLQFLRLPASYRIASSNRC